MNKDYPPPLPSAPDENERSLYAGFLKRAVAMVSDWIIISIFLYISWWFAAERLEEDLGFSLIFIFYALSFPFVYFVHFHSRFGQTPGKWVLGIKVAVPSGEEPGFGRSAFRTLGYSVSAFFFMAGFLWPVFDRRRQAWHDKLAGTVVLEI